MCPVTDNRSLYFKVLELVSDLSALLLPTVIKVFLIFQSGFKSVVLAHRSTESPFFKNKRVIKITIQ